MRNSLKNQAAAKWLAAGGRVFIALAILTAGGAGLARAAGNPPVVTGHSPTRDTTPTWTWTAGGGGIGTYRYKLDGLIKTGGATVTTATDFTPVEPLAEGPHTLYVQEQDAVGKWSTAGTRRITIDTTPPNAPVVTGKTPTRDTTPTWTWLSGGGDGKGTFRYKIDDRHLNAGATVAASTEYTPEAPLAEGKHILYVQERDAAGNWSAVGQKGILVDTTPPGVPVVEGGSPPYDTTPTWTWTTAGEGAGVYRYRLDNANLFAGAIISTLPEFTPDDTLASGRHTLFVQERDKAGNWSAAGSNRIFVSLLPDTGQTGNYTNTVGEDSDYTITPPSYTVHDNGTVTDNVTGLMWQRQDDGGQKTWDQAQAYCQDLDLAGFQNWRLPTKKELLRLVDRGRVNPSIDPAVFPDTKSYYYWSSTTCANYTNNAWYVNFSNGYVGSNSKDDFFYVRCARGGQ